MILTKHSFNLKGHPHLLVPVDLHINLSLYYLYFFPPLFELNITFFCLLLTLESQPQTHAHFPYFKPNLTNHRALEKPKRIEKMIQ